MTALPVFSLCFSEGQTALIRRDIKISVETDPLSFDIVLLSDLCRPGDIGLRIRRELQLLGRLGYTCALRHLPAGSQQEISPDIRRSIQEGLATPLAGGVACAAKLAIVYVPGKLDAPVHVPNLSAQSTVLVIDTPPDQARMAHWWSFAFGPMRWAPTNRWVRAALHEIDHPVPLEAEDWRALPQACRARPNEAPGRLRPVIGRVSTAHNAQWPAEHEAFDEIYPANAGFDVWLHGVPSSQLYKVEAPLKGRTTLNMRDMSVERFIEAIDALVYFPRDARAELPEAAIATAMASRKPVVLPPMLHGHFGPGAHYVEPNEAADAVTALLGDANAHDTLCDRAETHAPRLFSEEAYAARILRLAGPPPEAPSTVQGLRPNPSRKTALMVPSNGVGIGHASRLLALARRMEDEVEPVFLSLGQLSSIIEGYGYTAEYSPSHGSINMPMAEWNRWFRLEISDAIARYAPDIVVYDGNNPMPGLVHATMAQGISRLAWVRRAMCPEKPSPYLGYAQFFDCIIEPGEYAGAVDRGPTVPLRHQVNDVAPIRLLDADDLLSRDAARAELGLDPNAPAVLLQLGSGGTRDIIDLLDQIIRDLRRFDGLQIVIAEWSNGALALPRWPGTHLLRGFPIGRYFNAFDFSISAAGYNTFHEVIAFGLPTIFLANRHPSMDDQGARAEFAQEHGAGFDVKEDELALLPTLCRAMLNPQTNAVLRQGCTAFDASNGADAAAALLKQLARAA